MKHFSLKINNILLILSFLTSITICMDQQNSEKQDWSLVATIPHINPLTAAYFANVDRIATSAGEKQFIFDLITKQQLKSFSGNIDAVICTHPSQKVFGVSLGKPHDTDRKMITAIYTNWDHQDHSHIHHDDSLTSEKKSDVIIITSEWPIAPHFFDKQAQQFIRVDSDSHVLSIHDLSTQKDIVSLNYNSKIESACFHPFKNIIASVTSSPDNKMRGFDVETKKELFSWIYEDEQPSSIRFDETGNRLVVVTKTTVDIFDLINLCKPFIALRITNDKQLLQACLRGTSLAAASKTNMYLFSTENQQEYSTFPNNDTYALMDCFDETGNLFVVLDYKNARIYKKNQKNSVSTVAFFTVLLHSLATLFQREQ